MPMLDSTTAAFKRWSKIGEGSGTKAPIKPPMHRFRLVGCSSTRAIGQCGKNRETQTVSVKKRKEASSTMQSTPALLRCQTCSRNTCDLISSNPCPYCAYYCTCFQCNGTTQPPPTHQCATRQVPSRNCSRFFLVGWQKIVTWALLSTHQRCVCHRAQKGKRTTRCLRIGATTTREPIQRQAILLVLGVLCCPQIAPRAHVAPRTEVKAMAFLP